MKHVLFPSAYFDSTFAINFRELRSKGYNGLLFDIDNTLTMHNVRAQEKEVNFFVNYALAPPVLIHKLKLDNPESIVQVFEISYEAARYAYHYYKKWLRHGYGESDYTDYERQILHLFDPAS